MKINRLLLQIFLLTTQATGYCDEFARNVVEVIVRRDGGGTSKANGLLFTHEKEVYMLTVGHVFADRDFDRPIQKLVTYDGRQAGGQLVYDFYKDDAGETTDISVVKVSSDPAISCTYRWQKGILINEVARPNATVSIYNGRELVSGYRVEGEPTASSVFLKPNDGVNVLQGNSGGIAVIDQVVVGLVRAVDSQKRLIEVIRLDVAAALVGRSLDSLKSGDAAILMNWAIEDMRNGKYVQAKSRLDRTASLVPSATADKSELQKELALLQARYSIAHGKLYEAHESLEQLRVAADANGDWKTGAQYRIWLGRIGYMSGYTFRERFSDASMNPSEMVEKELLKPINEAKKHFEEAVNLLRRHNESALLGMALLGQAQGVDYEEQQRIYHEVVSLCRKSAPLEAVIACNRLKTIRLKLGFPYECPLQEETQSLSSYERAFVDLEISGRHGDAVELFRRQGTPFELAYAQELAGDAEENPDVALQYYKSALKYYEDNRFGTAHLYRVKAKSLRLAPLKLGIGSR